MGVLHNISAIIDILKYSNHSKIVMTVMVSVIMTVNDNMNNNDTKRHKLRFCSQSPHYAANCLQQGEVLCRSCATRQVPFMGSMSRTTRYRGTAPQSSLTGLKLHLFQLSVIGCNHQPRKERRKQGAQRKSMATSLKKKPNKQKKKIHQGPKIQSPTETRTLAPALVGRAR